jgi:hypothetical protein
VYTTAVQVRRTTDKDITSDIRSIVEVFGPTCFDFANCFVFQIVVSSMTLILTSPFFLIFQNP